MTRHQRLQRNLRSPLRAPKKAKSRDVRQLRAAIRVAFDKVIAPHFPPGTWDRKR